MSHTITPCKAVHSLDQCAFALSFDKPITKKNIQDISQIEFFDPSDGYSKKIKKPEDQASLSISYGEAKKNQNPSWRIGVFKNVIVISCYTYIRWGIFYDILEKLLEQILPHVERHSITSLGMKVIDKFNVETKPNENFSLTELFARNSSFIAPAFLKAPLPPAESGCTISAFPKKVFSSQKNIHHNHIGLSASADSNEELLIFTLTNLQGLAIDGEKIPASSDDAMRFISSAADFLHEQNKKTLRSVLARPVLVSIGLRKEASKCE